MSARTSLFSSLFLSLCLFAGACEREPAIVIRFDPVDLSGRDLQKARDLATARDAATPTDLALQPTAKIAPVFGAGAMRCHAEKDCVIVPDGCCGCANGGKQAAALQRDEKSLRATQRAQCKDVMCTMMVSNDPTCGKRAACVEGSCAMRDAGPSEKPRKLRPTADSPE